MDAEKIACVVLTSLMGIVLLVVGVRGILTGRIPPWRMSRITKPDNIYRDEDPTRFWGWWSLYACAGLSLIIYATVGIVRLL